VVEIAKNRINRLPKIAIEAPGLSFAGSVNIAADANSLERIDIEHLKIGRNDVRGLLIPGNDNGWTASLHGQSLDMTPFMDSLTAADEQSAQPPFSLSIEVDRVWVGPKDLLTKVVGTMARSNNAWRRIILDGNVHEGGKAFAVRLEPGEGGNRHLRIQADDAGSLLRTLGYYEHMKGGTLYIDAKFDDRTPSAPMDGRLLVRDYRIIQAPGLARLVSILSLTGIFDALQGEGVGFAALDAPFRFEDGVLKITDAKASGASLGYTASGNIYTHAEVVDIEGTLVPAYAINSMLGRIPLIGNLFSGGEEGGGVFAATYRMEGPLERPTVTVNPLSALAPGFLRNIFGIFDSKQAPPPTGNIFGPVPEPGGARIQ